MKIITILFLSFILIGCTSKPNQQEIETAIHIKYQNYIPYDLYARKPYPLEPPRDLLEINNIEVTRWGQCNSNENTCIANVLVSGVSADRRGDEWTFAGELKHKFYKNDFNEWRVLYIYGASNRFR